MGSLSGLRYSVITLNFQSSRSMSTSGADRYAFGGSRSGPKALEVGGPVFGLEATRKNIEQSA